MLASKFTDAHAHVHAAAQDMVLKSNWLVGQGDGFGRGAGCRAVCVLRPPASRLVASRCLWLCLACGKAD